MTVQFNEMLNLQVLAYQASSKGVGAGGAMAAVYIQGPDGATYYPLFASFDGKTDQATFQMADGLPNGAYRLHLSGPSGLGDLGGNPLVGNSPDGDYVIPFTVDTPARAVVGDPLRRVDQEPNGDPAHAQDLGVLFANDLRAGVVISRDFGANPSPALSDVADVYRFQVLSDSAYTLGLKNEGAETSFKLALRSADGTSVSVVADGDNLTANLAAGTYTISVSGWTPSEAAAVAYQLRVSFSFQNGAPVPLVSGPAPALSIHLDGAPTSPAVIPPPVLTVPSAGSSAALALASQAMAGPAASGHGLAVATPGELVVLGVGPVGGVTGTGVQGASAPVQVALQGSGPAIGQGVLGLVTLTQRLDAVGEGPSPTPDDSVAAALPGDVGPAPGAAPAGEDAVIASRGVADPGPASPATIPTAGPRAEVAEATVGGGAIVDAGPPAIPGDVPAASADEAVALDLAGWPWWASSLAVAAAAVLTHVAKHRLAGRFGPGRRWDKVIRRRGMAPHGPHALRPVRSFLARRKGRGAATANRS